MGSAWWHDEEELVLLDARKPNFKKTDRFQGASHRSDPRGPFPEMRGRFLHAAA